MKRSPSQVAEIKKRFLLWVDGCKTEPSETSKRFEFFRICCAVDKTKQEGLYDSLFGDVSLSPEEETEFRESIERNQEHYEELEELERQRVRDFRVQVNPLRT